MQKILMLHGAIAGAYQFDKLQSLLNNDFEIHSLNFPGHGGEQMPDEFSVQIFAEYVLSYLETNKIEKINIIGHSLGGYVACYLARFSPEYIDKIITIGTKFLWDINSALVETKMLNPDKIEEKIPKFAEILKQVHSPNDWKEVLNKTSQFLIDLGNNPPFLLEDFVSIENDILIIIGDKDTTANLMDTVKVYNALQKSRLSVFPDTYHPIEKMDMNELNYQIRSFLK